MIVNYLNKNKILKGEQGYIFLVVLSVFILSLMAFLFIQSVFVFIDVLQGEKEKEALFMIAAPTFIVFTLAAILSKI